MEKNRDFFVKYKMELIILIAIAFMSFITIKSIVYICDYDEQINLIATGEFVLINEDGKTLAIKTEQEKIETYPIKSYQDISEKLDSFKYNDDIYIYSYRNRYYISSQNLEKKRLYATVAEKFIKSSLFMTYVYISLILVLYCIICGIGIYKISRLQNNSKINTSYLNG